MIKRFSGKSIFLVGVFFLLWAHINAFGLPVLDGRTLSLFVFFIAIIFQINSKLTLKLNKFEIYFFGLLLLEFLAGIVISIVGETTGFGRFVNGYIGFIVAYLATSQYLKKANEYDKTRMIKSMFWGAAILTISMGTLQLLYVVTRSGALFSFISVLLFREPDYLLGGKVQLFTEPSLFGIYFYMLFVPSFLFLYKNDSNNKKLYSFVAIIVFIINCAGQSTRFVIDSLAFVGCYCIVSAKYGNFNKKMKYMLWISFAIIISFAVFYLDILGLRFRYDIFGRIYRLLHLGIDVAADASAQARSEYLRCAWLGFVEKPILGWGPGGYTNALISKHNILSNALAEAEVLSHIQSGQALSYSFVLTQICENGIIGILMSVTLVVFLLKKYSKKENFISSLLSIYFCYILIQNELIGFIVGGLVLVAISRNLYLVHEEVKK